VDAKAGLARGQQAQGLVHMDDAAVAAQQRDAIVQEVKRSLEQGVAVARLCKRMSVQNQNSTTISKKKTGPTWRRECAAASYNTGDAGKIPHPSSSRRRGGFKAARQPHDAFRWPDDCRRRPSGEVVDILFWIVRMRADELQACGIAEAFNKGLT
jgi:hypothetical protein